MTNENADDHTVALPMPGEDRLHSAIGVGVSLVNFQIDAEFDLSDSRDTASSSVINAF